MRRKTIVFLVIGLLLSLTLSLSAPTASAHTSTYCGHGHSGNHFVGNEVTHYVHVHAENTYHDHGYNHYSIGLFGAHFFQHHAHRRCTP
jgi:hypothetical protein